MRDRYHLRLGIESSFRKLKYDLGCVQFHSKQDDFIEMEILAHMIMFNVNSQICCKYSYIVNFKMACSIIHKHYLKSSSDRIFLKVLSIESITMLFQFDWEYTRAMKVQPPVCFIYRVA